MTTPRPFAAPEWDMTSKVCTVCSRSFGLMRRQHHCRNCGGAVCNDHSQTSVPIISLGFDTPVRVCDPCTVKIATAQKGATQQKSASASSSAPAVPSFSAAQNSDDEDKKPAATAAAKKVANCTCGMPLCICEEDPTDAAPSASSASSKTSSSQAEQTTEPKPKAARPVQGYNPFAEWKVSSASGGDVNEQMRDAVKSGDVARVQFLLKSGANVNFADDQGNQPLHLAAMLGHSEIARVLLEAGADTTHRNRMNEQAADLASVSLAAKITAYRTTKTFA